MTRKRNRTTRATRPDYNSLEPRQLLAGVIEGTASNDVLDLTYVDANTVSYVLNGDEIKTLDVTDGLRINMFGGDDRVSIDENISASVQVIYAEEIALTDAGGFTISTTNGQTNSLTIARRNVWNVGFVEDPAIAGRHISAGMINNNILFLGAKRLEGSSSVDVFNINASNGMSGLEAHGGEGSDLFRYSNGQNSPSVRGLGEGGHDRFVYFGTANAMSVGGTGYDIVDYRPATRNIGFEFDVTRTSIQKVFAPVGFKNFVIADSASGDNTKFNWVIDGNRTTLTEGNSGTNIELENFSEFYGSSYGFDRFWVTATAYDLEINDADWIQISSDMDAAKGDLSSINHDIDIVRAMLRPLLHSEPTDYVGDADGTISPRVVISDMMSDKTFGVFREGNTISGLAGGDISFRNEMPIGVVHYDEANIVLDNPPFPTFPRDGGMGDFKPELIIHSSSTGDDEFIVEATWTPTRIYSHGGDDTFYLGATGADGDLTLIDREIDIYAGEGNDRLYANNRGFEYSESYHLTPTGLVSKGPGYGFPDSSQVNDPGSPQVAALSLYLQTFEPIGFNASLEVARVFGSTNGGNHFLVDPSLSTRFAVEGSLESDNRQKITLRGSFDGQLINNDGTGAWKLSDGYQTVFFEEIELTPEIEMIQRIVEFISTPNLPELFFDATGADDIGVSINQLVDDVFADEEFV